MPDYYKSFRAFFNVAYGFTAIGFMCTICAAVLLNTWPESYWDNSADPYYRSDMRARSDAGFIMTYMTLACQALVVVFIVCTLRPISLLGRYMDLDGEGGFKNASYTEQESEGMEKSDEGDVLEDLRAEDKIALNGETYVKLDVAKRILSRMDVQTGLTKRDVDGLTDAVKDFGAYIKGMYNANRGGPTGNTVLVAHPGQTQGLETRTMTQMIGQPQQQQQQQHQHHQQQQQQQQQHNVYEVGAGDNIYAPAIIGFPTNN
eukprot:gnl/Chilomastix_caulleri/504.p1 GENE.gnl/Chilomastix_caulleri/504~~gnl/Chilomastix_caulleri/504.p1  ORF type:complete len:260 (+),score=95.45 gnl/Chilomastix_caulleri/504:184-963(+)